MGGSAPHSPQEGLIDFQSDPETVLFRLASVVPVSLDELADECVRNRSEVERLVTQRFQQTVAVDSTDTVTLTSAAQKTVTPQCKPLLKAAKADLRKAQARLNDDDYPAAVPHLREAADHLHDIKDRFEAVDYQSDALDNLLESTHQKLDKATNKQTSSTCHGGTEPTDDGQGSALPEVTTAEFTELTEFQRDILVVVAGLDTPKGLDVKDELSDYYGEEIHHGRLYPNLDTLAEDGFLEKTAINKRSNGYLLTDFGRAHLFTRRKWEQRQLTGQPVPEATQSTRNAPRVGGSDTEETASTEESIVENTADDPTETQAEESSSNVEERSEPSSILDDISKEFSKTNNEDANEQE